jgi:hypothetical protein
MQPVFKGWTAGDQVVRTYGYNPRLETSSVNKPAFFVGSYKKGTRQSWCRSSSRDRPSREARGHGTEPDGTRSGWRRIVPAEDVQPPAADMALRDSLLYSAGLRASEACGPVAQPQRTRRRGSDHGLRTRANALPKKVWKVSNKLRESAGSMPAEREVTCLLNQSGVGLTRTRWSSSCPWFTGNFTRWPSGTWSAVASPHATDHGRHQQG